ncbi:unnamed protein product [Amoebophrya sp. A120]|nr:unnamed protein product [Amoebophrya sp. A120]|eukprot:GSA120T00021237001.1
MMLVPRTSDGDPSATTTSETATTTVLLHFVTFDTYESLEPGPPVSATEKKDLAAAGQNVQEQESRFAGEPRREVRLILSEGEACQVVQRDPANPEEWVEVDNDATTQHEETAAEQDSTGAVASSSFLARGRGRKMKGKQKIHQEEVSSSRGLVVEASSPHQLPRRTASLPRTKNFLRGLRQRHRTRDSDRQRTEDVVWAEWKS